MTTSDDIVGPAAPDNRAWLPNPPSAFPFPARVESSMEKAPVNIRAKLMMTTVAMGNRALGTMAAYDLVLAESLRRAVRTKSSVNVNHGIAHMQHVTAINGQSVGNHRHYHMIERVFIIGGVRCT